MSMITKKRTALKASSTIHWRMIVVVGLFLLLCSSICLGDTTEVREIIGATVLDQKGSVSVKKAGTDSLTPVEINETLGPDQILVIEKGASLELRGAAGENIVLEGPKKGALQSLLLAEKSGIGEFVKKTLDKIPTVKGGEKKVDISTQAAGFTRGARSHRKPMPYIWKVKKSKEESDKH